MKQCLLKYINELALIERAKRNLSASDATPNVPWGPVLEFIVLMKNTTFHQTLKTTPYQMEFGGNPMPEWIACTPSDSQRMINLHNIMNDIASRNVSSVEDSDDHESNVDEDDPTIDDVDISGNAESGSIAERIVAFARSQSHSQSTNGSSSPRTTDASSPRAPVATSANAPIYSARTSLSPRTPNRHSSHSAAMQRIACSTLTSHVGSIGAAGSGDVDAAVEDAQTYMTSGAKLRKNECDQIRNKHIGIMHQTLDLYKVKADRKNLSKSQVKLGDIVGIRSNQALKKELKFFHIGVLHIVGEVAEISANKQNVRLRFDSFVIRLFFFFFFFLIRLVWIIRCCIASSTHTINYLSCILSHQVG